METAKILIVEDNSIVAEDIRIKLGHMGYKNATVATSYAKAIRAAEVQMPDIALMDIQLGGDKNGIDAAGELRRKYQVPIIYITAYADEETVARAKLTEPYGYLVKPFEDNELRSAVEIALYKQKSDRKIRESRKWLQTILKSIGDGVIATDGAGQVTFINPVAEVLTGWPKAEAIGKPMQTIFHIINESTLHEVENPAARVLREGMVVGLANHTLLVAKDGKKIPIADSGAPIKNDKGEIIGTVLVFRDQTKKRAARQALFESERLKTNVIESSRDCIKILDLEGRLRFISEGGQRLLEIDDIALYIGEVWAEFWKGADKKAALTAIAAAKDGQTGTFQGISPTALGAPKWWDVIVTPMRAPGGEVEQLLAVSRDITEKKQLETRLFQSQKMESIGTLAGGIAHDFNNILSSIIGFTELSFDEVKKGSNIEDNLQEIYSAGKRAKELVKQILAFARQTGEELKPIRIDRIAKEVLKFIRSSIPTSIEIKPDIQSDSLIMGNPTQVHQILMNFCTNAAHAMEDGGGVLGVGLKDVTNNDASAMLKTGLKPGDYIMETVSDTGIGIPPENLDTILEPYYTTKGPGQGTGMGLAVVQGIVESYGGKILVESTLDKGSVFSTYLPITKKRKALRPHEPEMLPTGTERILFVDDELPIAKMGRKVLERLGYSVTVRAGSLEALELFRSRADQFDLVITDMTMPDMTGDKLAVELLKTRPDIPVILCTGYSKKMSDQAAKAIGIKAFAHKPIVKADLARTVRKVLDAGRSEA